MRKAVIMDGVRTAIGRMGGSLKDIEVDFLSEKVIREAIKRSHVKSEEIEEVVWGHAKQSSDVPNLGRLAALRAELPINVSGYTVQRQCGSGLQAINNAAQQIICGISDVIIAGGAESMSNAPYYLRKARYGYGAGNAELVDPNTESQPRAQPIEKYGNLTMGLTAENLAVKYNISREEQDYFALESQEKAATAIKQGNFKAEIVPFDIKRNKQTFQFETDEHPRSTSFEKLAALKPVFKKEGTVTAGNSSGRNDGAAALVLMSEEKALKEGLHPRLRIIAQASVGVPPEIMGIGPVPATLKALRMAGLSLDDMDLIELNEAFAAQSLAVLRELNIDQKKVNVNGGAIALGHPIGGTGAILTVKIMHELERRGGRYGLITACIGGGQGIATIVENLRV
ncbi:thiolase family protein [Rummeliibacillus suwonensis]|uniref:thiolase family protein n=1 Tax=Rummeliibacillus suwonensis TaxID=1306154 RepID=UPI001AAFEB2A|nr:thiolase family protein [Rummeliibacillus suwonensis]MBO2535303.1 thiolase family protein [Rummeliibacillus suwonensis]